ncbi:MAG: chorismate mutase [Lachnospiraceae bacterium]|nr:chorismate mutase [Lachnospiraceae bacterium]
MDLKDVRTEIDSVDLQIKELFKKRMELADAVARVKAETEDAIYKPDREKEIIDHLTEGVSPAINYEYTALIKRIMEISRKYQYGRTLELRNCLDIPCLDQELIYKNIAVQKSEVYLCDAYERKTLYPVSSVSDMKEAIHTGKVDAGLGVIESVGMDVSDSIHKLLIEEKLFINHCDLVRDGDLTKKLVRFSKNLVLRPEDNRLKFMFVCPNRSGSLASILSMISDYNINMTEIHSRPDHNENWNYMFMVEIAANLLEKGTRSLIFQLMNETQAFQLLGSYTVLES